MDHQDVRPQAAPTPAATTGSRWHPRRPAVLVLAATAVTLGLVGLQPTSSALAGEGRARQDGSAGAFRQANLVSDIPGMAQLTDPALRNPWGLTFGPTTPAWVNNQFNPASACPDSDPECIPAPEDLLTKITLYRGADGVTPITKVNLEVIGSSPTGIVFNPTTSFLIDQGDGPVPARFLFNETYVDAAGTAPEGRITGWAPPPPAPPKPRTTSTSARKDPAFHSGLALVPGDDRRGPWLLAADAIGSTIDAFDARFAPVTGRPLFVDPQAADQGLTPYNVTYLGHRVYVAYEGDGVGAVSAFKPDGRFDERVVTSPRLQGPWGMAIAPDDWGRFGGKLLVGNVFDGQINAFGRHTGAFRGTLSDEHGDPLVNPGLWGLAFGNGVIGTPDTLLFVAGVGEEVGGFGDEIYEHGLMGAITPVGD